jgi:hypothetical protein
MVEGSSLIAKRRQVRGIPHDIPWTILAPAFFQSVFYFTVDNAEANLV